MTLQKNKRGKSEDPREYTELPAEKYVCRSRNKRKDNSDDDVIITDPNNTGYSQHQVELILRDEHRRGRMGHI